MTVITARDRDDEKPGMGLRKKNMKQAQNFDANVSSSESTSLFKGFRFLDEFYMKPVIT